MLGYPTNAILVGWATPPGSYKEKEKSAAKIFLLVTSLLFMSFSSVLGGDAASKAGEDLRQIATRSYPYPLYVAPTGPSGTGRIGDPITNLTYLSDLLTATPLPSNITVVFLNGTYYPQAAITFSPLIQYLTVIGQGSSESDLPVFSGTSMATAPFNFGGIDTPRSITVKNFVFTGWNGNSILPLFTGPNLVMVSNVHCINNNSTCINFRGTLLLATGCTFINNWSGVSIDAGSQAFLLSNSLITGSQVGLEVYQAPGPNKVESCQIQNNAIGIFIQNTVVKLDKTSVWNNGKSASDDVQCGFLGKVIFGEFDLCTNGTCLLTGERFDRCLVCGGSDTCVGCNGVPFSGVTNCTQSTLLFPSGAFQLSFTSTGNSIVLSVANTTVQDATVETKFLFIQEMTPNGTIVTKFDLQSQAFFVQATTQSIGGVQLPAVSFQKVFASTGASVTFTEAIVNSSLTVDVGSVEFDVAADTLKLTIEVSNWARESEDNVIEVGVVYVPGTGIQLQSQSLVPTIIGSQFLYHVLLETVNTFVTLDFADFGTYINENGSFVDVVDTNLQQVNNTNYVASFIFSSSDEWNDVRYDPDLAIVLQGDGGGGSGDGGSGPNLALIISLTVIIPIACLVVVAVIVIASALYFWRNRLARGRGINVNSEEMVQFDADESGGVAAGRGVGDDDVGNNQDVSSTQSSQDDDDSEDDSSDDASEGDSEDSDEESRN